MLLQSPYELEAALHQADLVRVANELAVDLRANIAIKTRIRAFLARCRAPASAAEMAEALAEEINSIRMALAKMPEAERFKDGRRVRFALRTSLQ